ncbi:MAG: hypothetical protein EOP36_14605 [Rubrivivax sp.]|nr:MAG: hypothetical protein EOP36_14605 [Rubrivivax sp.]
MNWYLPSEKHIDLVIALQNASHMKIHHIAANTALALILAGCASPAPPVNQSASPDGTQSIVFGRSDFIHNGMSVIRNDQDALISASVVNLVKPYTDADSLNQNAYSASGSFAIKAFSHEKGYFSTQLPPGKYYFMEFGYIKMIDGFTGMRTYMHLVNSSIKVPFITTFEVLPGKATYIGTMRHLVSDAGGYPREWKWGFSVKDDSANAKAWLQKNHPQWVPLMETKTAEMQFLPDVDVKTLKKPHGGLIDLFSK